MARRHRRNAWPRARAAHRTAAHIGWGYRRDRKKGPASVWGYLHAAGLSRSAVRKYRKARRTSPKALLKRRLRRHPRRHYRHRGFLLNGGRRGRRHGGKYSSFVKAYIRKHGWSRGAFKAAGRAWRHGRRRHAANDPSPAPFPVMGNRRHKKSRRYRRNGPVLPAFAWNRKRRKSHHKRKGHRRNPFTQPGMVYYNRRHKKSRRYRRNGPVLPGYAAFNPRRGYADNAMTIVGDAVGHVIDVSYWTDTVAPLAGGFIFSQFAGGMIQGLTEKVLGKQSGWVGSVQRVGSRALGAVAISAASLLVTKDKDMAGKILAGGLVAVLTQIIQEIFGMDTYSKITGMSDIEGFAADLTDELKNRIAQSVRSEIAASEGGYAPGTSAFVTTQDMEAAPVTGPGMRLQGMNAFVSTQDLSTAPGSGMPSGGPSDDVPVVADLNAFSDSFADLMLI